MEGQSLLEDIHSQPCRKMERIGKRLALIFYNVAPKSKTKEIAFVHADDVNDFCRHQVIYSYHRLISKIDWDACVDFLDFTQKPEESRVYAFKQRPHQKGCFNVTVDDADKPTRSPQEGSEIYMQMDDDPDIENPLTPLDDDDIFLFNDHWIYIGSDEVKKLLKYKEKADQFWALGLPSTCECINIQDKPNLYTRCKQDPDIHRYCSEIHHQQMYDDAIAVYNHL